MESKLTLKLDSETILKAKDYVRKHQGISLSRLVENYFKSLTSETPPKNGKIPTIVKSLAGAAKKAEGHDIKKEYTDYLQDKYT